MMGGEDKARGEHYFGGGIVLRALFWRIWLWGGFWFFGGACCGFAEELVGGLSQGAPGLLGILGSGARKPQGFLELGSRRGSVPSWLGGKDSVFRQFQAVCNNRKERTNFFFKRYFTSINFVQNESYDMNLCMENV
jgi:hypothetical protein